MLSPELPVFIWIELPRELDASELAWFEAAAPEDSDELNTFGPCWEDCAVGEVRDVLFMLPIGLVAAAEWDTAAGLVVPMVELLRS